MSLFGQKGLTHMPDWGYLFSRFLPRSSAPGGLNVIPKEAWLSCRSSSGVRLCWELEEPNGPKKKGVASAPRVLCNPFPPVFSAHP